MVEGTNARSMVAMLLSAVEVAHTAAAGITVVHTTKNAAMKGAQNLLRERGFADFAKPMGEGKGVVTKAVTRQQENREGCVQHMEGGGAAAIRTAAVLLKAHQAFV